LPWVGKAKADAKMAEKLITDDSFMMIMNERTKRAMRSQGVLKMNDYERMSEFDCQRVLALK
jgi:hypothetical protein